MALHLLGWFEKKARLDITGNQTTCLLTANIAVQEQKMFQLLETIDTCPPQQRAKKEQELQTLMHQIKILKEDARRAETEATVAAAMAAANYQRPPPPASDLKDSRIIRSPPRHEHRRRTHSHRHKEKLLLVNSQRLYFPPPLDKNIRNTISMQNAADHPITFKIKATATHRYVVKPRMGVLAPRERLDVHVVLKPTQDLPENLHDKFLLESRYLQPEELELYTATNDFHALWKHSRLPTSKTKIVCKFTTDLPANITVKVVQPDGTATAVSAQALRDGIATLTLHRSTDHVSDEEPVQNESDDEDDNPFAGTVVNVPEMRQRRGRGGFE